MPFREPTLDGSEFAVVNVVGECLHSPRYPQREFWQALELADGADITRAVRAINASEAAYYFDRQQSHEFIDLDDVDPQYLIAGYSPEKAVASAAYAHSCKKALRVSRSEAVSRPCRNPASRRDEPMSVPGRTLIVPFTVTPERFSLK